MKGKKETKKENLDILKASPLLCTLRHLFMIRNSLLSCFSVGGSLVNEEAFCVS